MNIEHVKNIKNSIYEMIRVLKSGGTIHLMCSNYDNTYEPHYMLDIGEPLIDNRKRFAEYVIKHGGTTDMLDTINFVCPASIIKCVKSISDS